MRAPQDPLFAPDNINYFQGNAYRVLFQRAPNVAFHIQNVNIPGLSVAVSDTSTPGLTVNGLSNQLTFDTIDIEFIVDEDLTNWLEIYNWLHEFFNPNTGTGQGSLQDFVTEMQLFIYDNNNKPNKMFKFHNLHPISLSSINLTTQSSGEPTTATVTCNYTTYELGEV